MMNQYKILFRESNTRLVYSKPDFDEIIKNAQPCYKLNISDVRTYRMVKDGIVYTLKQQYAFWDKGITVYVFESDR